MWKLQSAQVLYNQWKRWGKGHVQWVYLYRAADRFGKTLNFMLSERRNKLSRYP